MSMSMILVSVGVVISLFLSTLCEARVHGESHTRPWRHIRFVSSSLDGKNHNKLDVRVAHNGILAMEQLIPSFKENSVFLREVTNGHSFMQIIYQNKDTIVDCNMVRDQPEVEKFTRKFFKLTDDENPEDMDLESVQYRLQNGPQNTTFRRLSREQNVPSRFQELVDFRTLRDECKNLHRNMLGMVKQARRNDINRIDDDIMNAAFTEEDSHDDVTVRSHKRSKRSMFIYPGTNWCGKGSTATNYYDLGENIDTDKCCRDHDLCKYTIEGLSSNYNYFNYRLHTLSHCECDDQFHTCLKTSGDDVSEMVGNLFFNVISNKCFTLKSERVCAKRSWWGKCLRYKKQRNAELRDPLKY